MRRALLPWCLLALAAPLAAQHYAGTYTVVNAEGGKVYRTAAEVCQ